MAERTYKPGGDAALCVSVEAVCNKHDPPCVDIVTGTVSNRIPLRLTGSPVKKWLAPWLSTEDQESLLRVVRAGLEFAYEWATEFHGNDWPLIEKLRQPDPNDLPVDKAWMRLLDLRDALPPHIKARVEGDHGAATTQTSAGSW